MKKLFLFSVSFAAVVLNGCSTVNSHFTDSLQDPRPFTTEQSYAMKMLYKLPTVWPVAKDCAIDTAIWEDEVGTIKGGFRADETYRLINDVRNDIARTLGISSVKRDVETLIAKRGTIPKYLADRLGNLSQYGKAEYTAGEMATMALSAWLEAKGHGTLFGVGPVFSRQDLQVMMNVREVVGNISQFHLGVYVPPEKLELIKKQIPGCSEQKNKKAQSQMIEEYFRVIFVKEALKAAEEIGFKVVADVKVDPKEDLFVRDRDEKNHLNTAILENETFGCAKYQPGSPLKKHCQFQYQRDSFMAVIGDVDTNIYSTMTMRLIVSNNGSWLPEATYTNTVKLFEKIVDNNPDMFVFIPVQSDGGLFPTWFGTQYIYDKTGRHYFVVPVKRP